MRPEIQEQFGENVTASIGHQQRDCPTVRSTKRWPTLNATAPVKAQAQARSPTTAITFQILTRQGSAAPGSEKNYMSQGMLSGGFALVAYPEHWGRSGIMTFIVNQDGNVFERNLGEKSAQMGREMKDYNPDVNWKPVEDAGVFAKSERMETIQP